MNLIEKLGLEKCKQVIGGAPDWANGFCSDLNVYTASISGNNLDITCLATIRTAIADHECDHDWEDISCNGDLERQLICTYCSMKKSVPFGLNAKRWSEEDTDHCTDIRNHISPLMEVSER